MALSLALDQESLLGSLLSSGCLGTALMEPPNVLASIRQSLKLDLIEWHRVCSHSDTQQCQEAFNVERRLFTPLPWLRKTSPVFPHYNTNVFMDLPINAAPEGVLANGDVYYSAYAMLTPSDATLLKTCDRPVFRFGNHRR